jgi:hypothetical protein
MTTSDYDRRETLTTIAGRVKLNGARLPLT